MHKIDPAKLELNSGTRYPKPFDQPCLRRSWHKLGDAAGLTQFGVSLVRLPPGTWSSQRHWHMREDEFVWITEGEVVLVTDDGEELFRAGDCAGFKGGVRNGHHFQNRSDRDAVLLTIGSRDDEDHGEYSDIDMVFLPERYSSSTGTGYAHKDGTPYPIRP